MSRSGLLAGVELRGCGQVREQVHPGVDQQELLPHHAVQARGRREGIQQLEVCLLWHLPLYISDSVYFPLANSLATLIFVCEADL